MVLIRAFFLIAYFVINSDAIGFIGETVFKPVSCVAPSNQVQSLTINAEWSRDQIHPVLLCVKVSHPVVDCSPYQASSIKLAVNANDIRHDFAFSFRASDVKTELCRVVQACDIAKFYVGQNITEARITGFLTFPAQSASEQADFQLKIVFTTWKLNKVDEFIPTFYKIQSFICQFKNCLVVSTPSLAPAKTTIFTIMDGDQAPRCEESATRPTADGQFSVTDFIYEKTFTVDVFKAIVGPTEDGGSASCLVSISSIVASVLAVEVLTLTA